MISTRALFEIVKTNDYDKLSSIINNLTPADLLKTSKKNISILPHAIEYRSTECFNILLESNKFDFRKMNCYNNGFYTAFDYYKLAPNEKNMYYIDKLIQKNLEFFDDDTINHNVLYMNVIFVNINLYELFFPILINSIHRNPTKYLNCSFYSSDVFSKLYNYCIINNLLTNESHRKLVSDIINVNNFTLLRCIEAPYKIEPTILSIAIPKSNLEIIQYLIKYGSDYILEKEKLLDIFVSSMKNQYNINKEKFNIFMLLINNYKFENIEKKVDDLLNYCIPSYNYNQDIVINIILCMVLRLIQEYISTGCKFDKLFIPIINFKNIPEKIQKVFKSFFEEVEKIGFIVPKELQFIKDLKTEKTELLFLKKLKNNYFKL
jgi:hypothetical protein